jgi:hypothetical protein
MSVIRGRVIRACIINLRPVIDRNVLTYDRRLLNLKEESGFALLVLPGLKPFDIFL